MAQSEAAVGHRQKAPFFERAQFELVSGLSEDGWQREAGAAAAENINRDASVS